MKLKRLMIRDGTIIKKGSKIEWIVIIGKNCLISNDTYIGSNSSIVDNSIIIYNCTINCNVKIKNSIIVSNLNIFKKSNDDKNVFLLGEVTKIFL